MIADSVAEFSGTQGQANWYYGYYSGSFTPANFALLPQFTFPWFASQKVWLIDLAAYWTYIGPGGGHPNTRRTTPVTQWAVRRWVSPVAGQFAISGALADTQTGPFDDGVAARIFLDGTEIFNHVINPNETSDFLYEAFVTVTVGSTLDFAIDPLGNDSYDTTKFTIVITSANVRTHTMLLDPRRTYLRFNEALDKNPVDQTPPLGPEVFDLAANGIAPGDHLFLERSGRFRWSASFPTEEGRNIWAVFSQNQTVLPNPDLDRPLDDPPIIYPPKRIPGAVAPDLQQVAAIETGRTITASPEGVGSPTDFPEDFMADRVLVRVPNAPVAATHLMFGAGDIKWADNLDGPPADFRISITQIRDPDFDTDGDGTSDLDEILSGTEYSNPLSHPSLTIFTSPLPGNARTEWTAQPFRIYEIEESPDLSSWSPIESPPLFNVPTPMQRDYPFTLPNRFFRLKVKGMFWD